MADWVQDMTEWVGGEEIRMKKVRRDKKSDDLQAWNSMLQDLNNIDNASQMVMLIPDDTSTV